MNFKIVNLVFLVLFWCGNTLFAQTVQGNPVQDSVQIYTRLRYNQVLLPLPDTIITKKSQLEVLSSNSNLLEVLNVEFISEQPFAVINVVEKEVSVTVSVEVNAEHGNSTDTLLMFIQI